MLKIDIYEDYNDHDFTEINKYKSFTQTNSRIIAVQDKLTKAGPYAYFGTLSFQYDLAQWYAISVASIHWRKVQKQILGKYWIKKKITPMTGLLVMETHPIRNKRTTREFSTCHFHHLIDHHPKLPEDRYEAAAQLDYVFAKAAKGLTHKNKRWQLVSKYGTKVLPVESSRDICGYAAKEAWSYQWNWSDRVRYLCKDGAV
jgi:hypothetical protein